MSGRRPTEEDLIEDVIHMLRLASDELNKPDLTESDAVEWAACGVDAAITLLQIQLREEDREEVLGVTLQLLQRLHAKLKAGKKKEGLPEELIDVRKQLEEFNRALGM